MVDIFQEYEPNYGKARLLAPFAERYRLRADRGKFPPSLRLIAIEILVTTDPKIVLVKNSKAGCTTAAHMLYQATRGKPFDGDIHRPDIGLFQGVPHLNTVRSVLVDPASFKLTTVRHPVARAVSGFTDFFLDKKNLRSDQHMNAITHFGFSDAHSAERNFDSFLDYVDYALAKDPLHIDRHFRSQTVNTAIAYIDYDRVCRVENLVDDLDQAFAQAGISDAAIAGIDRTQRNASRAAGFEPNADQIRRIEDLYSEDMDQFGY